MMFLSKIKYLLNQNINNVLCIQFNHIFSIMSPKDFIINILINKLHIKYIVIGEDCRFGMKRNGDIHLLKNIGKKYNFNVITIPSVYRNGIKISSTQIRKALSKNDIILTESLLGHKISIYGRVIHGDAIGRKLGYPTANILLDTNLALQNGVYAVTVTFDINQNYKGIANIGLKKNDILNQRLLEVYLFNTNINLYGCKIEVFIQKKIREEMLFNSIKALKHQIFQDIQIVQKYFKKNINI